MYSAADKCRYTNGFEVPLTLCMIDAEWDFSTLKLIKNEIANKFMVSDIAGHLLQISINDPDVRVF